jgi:hypothetical protein
MLGDTEMARKSTGTRYDVLDNIDGSELARDVSAATAAELVGLSVSWVNRLERHVAKYGSLKVGNIAEDFVVRRTQQGGF